MVNQRSRRKVPLRLIKYFKTSLLFSITLFTVK